MEYLVILIYLIYLVIFYDFYGKQKGYNIHYNLVLILLICLAGFRYRLGIDTVSYMSHFDSLPDFHNYTYNNLISEQLEKGWILTELIFKTIWNDYFIFQFSISAFINISIFRFIKKNTHYLFTNILLYYIYLYITFNFEILRQAIAFCIFLFSIDFLLSGKWLKYYLLIIIAFFFHQSAIIFFVFPFFKYINFRLITITILAILITLILLYLQFNFLSLGFIFPKATQELILYYYEDSRYGLTNINFNGIIYNLLVISFSIILLYFYKTRKYFVGAIALNRNYFIAFISLYITFNFAKSFFMVIYRFSSYFSLFNNMLLVWGLAYLLHIPSFKKIKLGLVVLFILYNLSFINTFTQDVTDKISVKNYYRYYPYSSIFTKKEEPNREYIYRRLGR